MQNPAFGFGASGTQPASSGLFGTTAPNTSVGGLFGTGTQNAPAFGTGGGLFGNTTTTSANTATRLFGTPTSTPSFGTTSNVGAFGSVQPTVLSFNDTPTTTPAFGTTATASPAFGSALTSFGATATTPSFGATASTPGFGATATTPGFGATATTPSFGATATTPSFGGIGTPAPSFGTATTAIVAPTFGSALTATPSFGPTSTSAVSAPSFGTTLTQGFGGATPNFGSTTTAPPSFGATSTAAPLFGLTSTTATSTAAAPSTGLGFNLGGTGATPIASIAPTTASVPVGLGGLATTQTKIVTTQKDVTPKDQPLPNEIHQTVESFKEFVKQQKVHSSDIAKCSIRDFRKVEQDITQLTVLLGEVESQLQKNRQLAENLKYDTARCLKDVEIAQRTQDTPPGLQYENVAPLKFFLNLADKFEREMQVLKEQIEGADNYVKNYRSPNPLTPQDLALGMRRLHESFVALAGRLHSVHSQVESQKEAYLQTKRQLYNDPSNPFDSLYKPEESFKHILNYSPPKVATGPTPFGNLAVGNTQLLALQQNQNTMAYQTPTTTASSFGGIGFGTTFGTQPARNATLLFGSSSLAPNSSSFQLQKPPTGNKRGKQ